MEKAKAWKRWYTTKLSIIFHRHSSIAPKKYSKLSVLCTVNRYTFVFLSFILSFYRLKMILCADVETVANKSFYSFFFFIFTNRTKKKILIMHDLIKWIIFIIQHHKHYIEMLLKLFSHFIWTYLYRLNVSFLYVFFHLKTIENWISLSNIKNYVYGA